MVANNEPDVTAFVAAVDPDVAAFAAAVDPDVTAFETFVVVAALPPVILIAPFILNTPLDQLNESLPAPLKKKLPLFCM